MSSKTVNTVVWSGVERLSVQGIQFVLTLIIARLVQPSDYGLIAIVGIFLAIAQTFVDSGFSNALIQKQNRTEVDYATVFYFSVIIGVIVYVLLYCSAPAIAFFFNEPDLILVTRVIGLVLIINSFSIVQRAILTIELNFKKQAIISFISVIISGVICIYLAYIGWGIWALVTQILLSNLLNTLLFCFFVNWIPLWTFSRESFKTLFSFGSKLLLSGLLHTVYINLYSLVIGKKFAAVDLGYYNRAYTIAYFPSSNISNIIIRAIYPIQCQVQDDEQELKKTFLQYIAMSAFIVFPLMIGLCVLAKPFILVFLTDKWLPITTILQILCIAYMWDSMMSLNCNILKVKGRSDYFLRAEVIKKIVAVIILIVTMSFNVEIMSFGLLFYSFIDILIISQYTRKVISCTLIEQVKAIFPSLFLSIVMGIIIFIVVSFISSCLLKLIVGVVVGFFCYISLSLILSMKEILYIKHILLFRK